MKRQKRLGRSPSKSPKIQTKAIAGRSRGRAKGGQRPSVQAKVAPAAVPAGGETPAPASVPDQPSPGPHFLIAAVGASAGGGSAFSALLRAIAPHTPLALLLVQHLSAEHKSLLPELLDGITKMPVETARDRLTLR